MIRYLIASCIIFIGFIAGFSLYLQSDDLGNCGVAPSLEIGCEAVDAVVAVSGGDTGARTRQAIDLYKNGWANKLIFSGAAQDKTGPSNAAAMKSIAVEAGISDEDIMLDEYSETTKQNAENSQTIFSQLNVKKVILVTSGYHQRRAGLEFSKRNSEVKIINHPTSSDKDWSIWWWLTPKGWWLAMSETVKIIIFYISGLAR
ncbi:MAG: YdcF family protein [Candidatus Saccharibacteria bacterium]